MILCYVTDRRLLGKGAGEDAASTALLDCIARAADAGVDWVQIREKDLSARSLVTLTRHAIECASAHSAHANLADNAGRLESSPSCTTPFPPTVRVIVNDRLDVALAAGAAGVHLTSRSAPVANVVLWLRAANTSAGLLVGVSCHQLDEALAAQQAGANCIFFGPIFETPSKIAFGPPQGIQKLAEICAKISIPVLAIGGITEENAVSCIRAGASGIAAVRMFQERQSKSSLGSIVSKLRSTAQGTTS